MSEETQSKRTNGFTTYDKELHDVLDKVDPKTERMYRKLLQMVNNKRGDREAFPSRNLLMEKCGFTSKATLDRALKEAAYFRLISITKRRGENQEYDNNVYHLTNPEELPSGESLEHLVSRWNHMQEQKSEAEKARKEAKKDKGVASQWNKGSLTDGQGVVSPVFTNKDEVNYDEVNYENHVYKENETEEAFSALKDTSSELKEDVISESNIPIPAQDTIFDPELKNISVPCIQENEKYPKGIEIVPIYENTHGSPDDKFMAVVANFRHADMDYLKGVLILNGIRVDTLSF